MDPIPIFSLVGDYQFPITQACLSSLRRSCLDEYQLVLLNDGSLKEEQGEWLMEALPGARLVSRGEMRERMAGHLAGRPRCERFLDELIFAWKLLGPAALAEETGGDLVEMDSDVMFYQPFTGLDRRGEAGEDYVYMPEGRDSYSMSFRSRFIGADRIRLPEGANAGLLFMRRGIFDWDYVEWFLGRAAYRRYPGVVEQTAWAALGARAGCYRFDPMQMNIPEGGGDVTPELVGQHLLGQRKRLAEHAGYGELVRAVIGEGAGEVARLRTQRAPMPGFLRSVVKKGVKQLVGKESAVSRLKNPSELMVMEVRKRWGRVDVGAGMLRD